MALKTVSLLLALDSVSAAFFSTYASGPTFTIEWSRNYGRYAIDVMAPTGTDFNLVWYSDPTDVTARFDITRFIAPTVNKPLGDI